MYQLKEKDSEIKPYPMCLGNIPKYFTTTKKYKAKWIYACSVDFNIIDANNILVIHKYLMKIT